MSTTQVTISTPRVHTLQVTVRALRIGTKQVTQSVFRQLPRRSVWDPMTGQLQGTPWGLVNYFWHDCGPTWPERPHLHVVWQCGERLFRDCVFDPQRHRPEGVEEAHEKVQAADQRTTMAAHYVCALALWQRGWDLAPCTAPTTASVRWPCGVETTFEIPSGSYSRQTLLDHFATTVNRRTPRAMESRLAMSESCEQVLRPEGDGWYQWHHAMPTAWTRARPETTAEWEDRTRADLTKAYDALGAAIRHASDAWELTHLPRSVDEAKQSLNYVPQALLTAQEHDEQLVKHFDTVYAHMAELDQLFIAV